VVSARPGAWRSTICDRAEICRHWSRCTACWAAGRVFFPLAQSLRQHFDVILPDARGHGGSSAPPEGYLYPEVAGDVVDILQGLELDRPVLVGHSMGGMTAAVAAARLDVSLSRLVLIDPTFISPAWQREVFDSGLVEEHRTIITTDLQELVADASRRHPHRTPELIEALTKARVRTSIAAFDVLTPPNPDYHDLIDRINVPTLLVLGDKGVVSIDAARDLETRNLHLTYEVIPDAGHGLPYDKPEQVATSVLAFLR
jgi:N-formylmaleamate deformylase